MTRLEHLLVKLNEECVEVAQRVDKALRFGLAETQPGQSLSNAERIIDELLDVFVVVDMLTDEGALQKTFQLDHLKTEEERKTRIEKYLLHSKACGTLDK